MNSLYQSPLRVYLLLGLLAGLGFWSVSRLSVSLFPQKNQVSMGVSVPYGPLSSAEFAASHGQRLESALQQLSVDGYRVKRVTADYSSKNLRMIADFEWGIDPETAKREFSDLIKRESALWPEEIRDRVWPYSENRNSGFFAAAVYSLQRPPDAIYGEMKNSIDQWGATVKDAEVLTLWNPKAKAITIEVSPEYLAQAGLSLMSVQTLLFQELEGLSGGTLTKEGSSFSMDLQVNSSIASAENMEEFVVGTVRGTDIKLKDIAKVTLGPAPSHQNSFKTSGLDSLIIWAQPKAGGNIKKMSEDIKALMEKNRALWPADVDVKILVDPSEFINSAIESVFHEVGLASLLAVIVLFLFIGSFKNVATAAIEIPLSLILAFIFMWAFGLNLNLISLGGLALSAGMNVDASVVVMENIFRHFELQRPGLPTKEKFQVLLRAVNEVKLAIIASTISSLVVFLPLIATKGMTNSILGDLAQAVIFSHGLSAFVALILVPTVRWQMMKFENNFHVRSPIEKWLVALERIYSNLLTMLLARPRQVVGLFFGLMVVLGLVLTLLVPRLEKEVIGRPDTDWVMVSGYSPLIARHEGALNLADEIEAKVMKQWKDDVIYTFTQVSGSSWAGVMARLKDKSAITRIKKEMEAEFQNSSTVFYNIEPWNPSEMKIPKSYDFRFEFIGVDYAERVKAASVGSFAMQEAKQVEKVEQNPSLEKSKVAQLQIIPRKFEQGGVTQLRQEVAFMSRLATEGVQLRSITQTEEPIDVFMMFPKGLYQDVDQLKALPLRHQGQIVSLGSVANFNMVEKAPTFIRENGRELVSLRGQYTDDFKKENKNRQNLITETLSAAVKNEFPKVQSHWMDPQPELSEAIEQLKVAILLSVLLIFVTMVLQFNDVASALLILVAIPLGLIGVILSLYIFKSTLSLNSLLGVILLNGISVANSIILVDFIRQKAFAGVDLREAAVSAAKSRLRPILMTTLTTSLGMLPIAIGMGEGGKVLQPLGIAVVGGLGFSTLTTLFVVPGLQYLYLKNRARKMEEPT